MIESQVIWRRRVGDPHAHAFPSHNIKDRSFCSESRIQEIWEIAIDNGPICDVCWLFVWGDENS